MNIIKRPPGDLFSFRLFVELNSKIKQPKDSIYIWSCVLDPIYEHGFWPEENVWVVETELDYRVRLADSIKSDLVVLGVKDHLTSGDFDYWGERLPAIVEYLKDLFDFYRNKKFILFTSVENLGHYITAHNVKIIPWGGDITNQQREYQKLDPVLDKNLDSNYNFLSLNRNKRSHRAMLVSLLHGLEIQNSGLISCMFKDSIQDLFEYSNWKVKDKQVYENGFKRVKESTILLGDDFEIYQNRNNDNVSNFRNKLSSYYRETFVEIVTETSYTEQCFNLTEKTLNSIYGCSFPILICSSGTVQFLRDMGLDMFDDIVDHSYDNIEDPSERLEAAITKNVKLLTDTQFTKELWIKNKYRFERNVDFCKEKLYNFYSSRATNIFNEIINDPNF